MCPLTTCQQTIAAVFPWPWLVFGPLPGFSELSLGLPTSCNCQCWILPWADAFYIPASLGDLTSNNVSCGAKLTEWDVCGMPVYLICPLWLVIKGKNTRGTWNAPILLFLSRLWYQSLFCQLMRPHEARVAESMQRLAFVMVLTEKLYLTWIDRAWPKPDLLDNVSIGTNGDLMHQIDASKNKPDHRCGKGGCCRPPSADWFKS